MNLFTNPNIPFIAKRKAAYIASLTMVGLSIISLLFIGGLKYGIDFAGGTLIQLKFKEPVAITDLRKSIKEANLGSGDIQEFGEPTDVIIHIESKGEDGDSDLAAVTKALQDKLGADSFTIERTEVVGPKVGKDLSAKAMLAVIYTLVGILIYVSYRFEYRFAVAAVAALVHDTLITVGMISLTGKEFSLTVLAAILTVIGYSLNDTIVVFDRIRETLRLKRNMELPELINLSINETLSRTVITSGTVFFVVIAIFLFGGAVIHDFAFTLLVGVVVGTYSSIYIASPILISWPGASAQSLSLAMRKK